MVKQLLEEFLLFSPGPVDEVRIFFAPGRVNLMGEHLDYNGGFVLPAAINVGTWCLVRPRKSPGWRIKSRTESLEIIGLSSDILPPKPERGFANYPLGVVAMLRQADIPVPDADCYFAGTIPQGAGLSSSASLEVVTAYALTHLAGLSLDRTVLAKLAQQAENDYVGVPCGLMDQLTVTLGKEQHALLLNMQDLTCRPVPVPMQADWALVIVDSRKPHQLIVSPYRKRREECAAALALLHQQQWPIRYLADIRPDDLPRALAALGDPVLERRVRHIVHEQERTIHASEVLAQGDFTTFGRLMNASHESLRLDYEVTGPELDVLAMAAWSVPGCAGSRMTGAGFGGSTIAWVSRHAIDQFIAEVQAQYESRFGYAPAFLVASLADGVHEVFMTPEEAKSCEY